MRTRFLQKIGLCSVSALLAVLLLGSSVPGSTISASPTLPAAPISRKAIFTAVARKRAKAKLVRGLHLVASVQNPQPTLLPAVNQRDIRPAHRLLADAVIRTLPSGCAQQLKTFIVRYDKPDRRGLGGTSTIILDGSVPDAEFAALLVHECGHLAHGNLLGNSRSGLSAFRDGTQPFYADSPAAAFFAISWKTERVAKSGTTKDYVSGYARSDAFEDFAETLAAYVLHRPALEAQAMENDAVARKLAWMETSFPFTPPSGLVSEYAWNGTPPWDVTKLAYRWEPALK